MKNNKSKLNKENQKNNAPLVEEKNPQGVEGGLNQQTDEQKNVGKGGTPGASKVVQTTPNPVQKQPGGAKRTDNLGAGERNKTPNSTLNVEPVEVPDVDKKGPKCQACKGEGLEDPENPNTPICSNCKGTGRV